MGKGRYNIQGFRDYTGVSLSDIISDLKGWLSTTSIVLKRLRELKMEAEANSQRLEDSDSIIGYIEYSIDLFEGFEADYRRILKEVKGGVEEKHIEILKQISETSRNERLYNREFKNEHIVKTLKDESMRPLLDKIYEQAGNLLFHNLNLNSLSQRLRTYVGRRRIWLYNPWVIGIGCIIITFILTLSISHLRTVRKEKQAVSILRTRVNDANKKVEDGLLRDALDIYSSLLGEVSEKKNPELFAEIKHNESVCYLGLTVFEDKYHNLLKSIQASQEALKVYRIEKYPSKYAKTQNNLGTAYYKLSEIMDKEVNLEKAIHVFEEALIIFTLEKYPDNHKVIMSNLEKARIGLKEDGCL